MNRFRRSRVNILSLLCVAISFAFIQLAVAQESTTPNHRVRLVIHGGAGTITKASMTAEKEKQYYEKLTEALEAGYAVLQKHGTSLDAVETVIRILEDSPLFNAGKGAVFTHEGTNELDASIMDGKTLRAGAVAAVKHVKNPIGLARLVMEKSPHVMLVGDGAEAFGKSQGVEMVPQEYFFTQRRWDQLQTAIEKEKQDSIKKVKGTPADSAEGRHGTVGCVALDEYGNLAAGTSTGGTTNKRFGRVGDSPIIGAGTYANNATCAVSCTGDGEYFIRAVAAHSVSMLMESSGMTVQKAAEKAIETIGRIHGTGGLIALDKNGNFTMPFNTEGMYRGYIDENGKPMVKIYKE
ncbi:MAG: isoaspartyl peptidase/L-asparaginase [Ignavibacteriae bacterium]|nr:isoaspartyl peptidase/L-asparaginase [Ignavibacteria bacterium]MBI3364041.1 isoaspartyl peptidase/L-asparaginase [Ignavibacteriota bacterium]